MQVMEDKISYLNSNSGWQPRGGTRFDCSNWRFCFHIGLFAVDLSWVNLLGIASRKKLSTPAESTMRCLRSLLEENRLSLITPSVESVKDVFRGPDGSPAPQYCKLPSGKIVRPRFCYYGRDGQWLTLTRFNGYILNDECDFSLMPAECVNDLCDYLHMMSGILDQNNLAYLVEEAAAWHMFESDAVPVKMNQMNLC